MKEEEEEEDEETASMLGSGTAIAPITTSPSLVLISDNNAHSTTAPSQSTWVSWSLRQCQERSSRPCLLSKSFILNKVALLRNYRAAMSMYEKRLVELKN